MQQEVLALNRCIRLHDHKLSRAQCELDDLKRVHAGTLQAKHDLERDLQKLRSTIEGPSQHVQSLQSEKEFYIGTKGLEISDAMKLYSANERANDVFEKERPCRIR